MQPERAAWVLPCLPLTIPMETKLRQLLPERRGGLVFELHPNPLANHLGEIEQVGIDGVQQGQNLVGGQSSKISNCHPKAYVVLKKQIKGIDKRVVIGYNLIAMNNNKCVQFGEFVRATRLDHGISAREAANACDMLPSNFSKLEHGALQPPRDAGRQRLLASAIGIKLETAQAQEFFDLAASALEAVPVDLAEIITRDDAMPLLLRTIGNKRLNRKEIERLIAIVRGENTNGSKPK